MENSSEIVVQNPTYGKLAGFMKLAKINLSLLVVFSAALSYLTIAETFELKVLLALIFGGMLVTASANAFNQVIEKDLDKLMRRTQNRPLPLNILTRPEATIFAALIGVLGVGLIWYYTNTLSGILSLTSILLYTLFYTPLKRKTPFSVFVGAVPGAMPTLIGAIAGSHGFGEISMGAWILFFIQFMWQFPHFWAIAWVQHDDYQRAGFFMLPSHGGRNASSGFQIIIYTLFLVPISLLPFIFQMPGFAPGPYTTIAVLAVNFLFFIQAYRLYKLQTVEAARKLMFGSFLYLPVVQLALFIGIKYII